MSQMSLVRAERAEENRAYVRKLLWQRQPAFAAALAAAERSVSCSACPFSQLMRRSSRGP